MNGSKAASRIVLGTVQFGLAYGLANTRGQVTPQEARAVLSAAWDAGVRTLDTAVLYGDSEAALGNIGVPGWDVITKLPELPAHAPAAAWVEDQVKKSLARLRIGTLHGLMLHEPRQLCQPEGAALYDALLHQRERGRVRLIGISVYGPDEIEALPSWMKFDIVQAPWSVLDQRMTRSGWASRLRAEGCAFHARSVFLQGLLLMEPAARPARFQRWNNVFQAWDRWLAGNGLAPLEACLQHAIRMPEIDRVVIGVDSVAQLQENLAAACSDEEPPPIPSELHSEDPGLLNPSNWNTA